MSLCVAWKYEDQKGCSIYFAADSCAVVGDKIMPFSGIKVLELPLHVTSAVDSRTGQAEELSSVTYGMAFAGSYFAAFLLKELVTEMLTHLQFLGAPASIRFEKVCDLVLGIHKHFHAQIRDNHKGDYEIDFFLGGYCGAAQRVRVAKFFVDPKTEEPAYKEVLTGSGFSYETIGIESAQARFRDLMHLSLAAPCRVHYIAFRRLRDIIKDSEHKFVTGAIQHGEFVGESFKLAGTSDVVFEDGRLKVKWYVCGTDSEVLQRGCDFRDLQFGRYTFGVPFNEDVKGFDLFGNFWENAETHHTIDEQITFVPYDSRWPALYGGELRELRKTLGNLPIEHIGSTAVPDMAAVPIVDLMVGVEALGDAQNPPLKLDPDIYEYLRDKLPCRQPCYRNRVTGACNLYVVEKDGAFWKSAIQLRDFLRKHPEECAAYTRRKAMILNTGSWTLIRYARAKMGYLQGLIKKASESGAEQILS